MFTIIIRTPFQDFAEAHLCVVVPNFGPQDLSCGFPLTSNFATAGEPLTIVCGQRGFEAKTFGL